MGKTDLPSSYMPMLYRFVTGHAGDDQRIETITRSVFFCSLFASLAVNRDLIYRILTMSG
jgi:hypothetical protein